MSCSGFVSTGMYFLVPWFHERLAWPVDWFLAFQGLSTWNLNHYWMQTCNWRIGCLFCDNKSLYALHNINYSTDCTGNKPWYGNTMNHHEGHVICMDDTMYTLGLFCCDPILCSVVFEGDFEIVIFMIMHAMTFKVDTHMQSYWITAV
jgi:hypothetical protein